MSEDKIDLIARASFRAFKRRGLKEPSNRCLSDEAMSEYVDGVLEGSSFSEEILSHVMECDLCFSKSASAVSALKRFNPDSEDGEDIARAIAKAKAIPRTYGKKGKGPMKRNKYLFVSAAFFLLSLFFKGYFLQFLTAASIFGFKWVMDTGGSKALIMIYDAWQHRKNTGDEEEDAPIKGRRM